MIDLSTSTHRRRRLKRYARSMRREPTEAERLLKNALLQVASPQVRQRLTFQAILGQRYIADILVARVKLVIEIDGGYHDKPEQKAYDERRTAYLTKLGFTIRRFTNAEVYNDPVAIANQIIAEIETQWPKRLKGKRSKRPVKPSIHTKLTKLPSVSESARIQRLLALNPSRHAGTRLVWSERLGKMIAVAGGVD